MPSLNSPEPLLSWVSPLWGILPSGEETPDLAVWVEWLEGEFTRSPAFIWIDEGWKVLEGLEEPGLPLSITPMGQYFLAYTANYAGVYEAVSGKRIWSHDGPCPVTWPPVL